MISASAAALRSLRSTAADQRVTLALTASETGICSEGRTGTGGGAETSAAGTGRRRGVGTEAALAVVRCPPTRTAASNTDAAHRRTPRHANKRWVKRPLPAADLATPTAAKQGRKAPWNQIGPAGFFRIASGDGYSCALDWHGQKRLVA